MADSPIPKLTLTSAQDLRKARVEVARRELIASSLNELSYGESELPEDVRMSRSGLVLWQVLTT